MTVELKNKNHKLNNLYNKFQHQFRKKISSPLSQESAYSHKEEFPPLFWQFDIWGLLYIKKSLTSAYLGMKNAWSISLQAFFFSDFLAKLLFNFGANYYTNSNVHSYFAFQNGTPYV
ncbi:hypothetical protein [Rossellomorea aquimaris]|uniref:hypothetical protein n=1 Tax=Rossellomorea aquimaris TaxID=189382 RepID=UPI000DEABA34|nr:hypothetical protein [Rossellomorea aquimaris]